MTIAPDFRIPDDIDKRLDILARETGKSKMTHILEAIVEYLEEQEDIRNAEAILAKVKAGTEKTYTAEEVRKILELEN